MCISGKRVPIPKGTVWAWKVVRQENGRNYPLCQAIHNSYQGGFDTCKWLNAEKDSLFPNNWGFHALKTQNIAREIQVSWSPATGLIRVRLRGILEATTEGYRAKEMFIPTKQAKAKD